MEEWKASFRDIYGREPVASDLSIAPKHVKGNQKFSFLKNGNVSEVLQCEKRPENKEEKQVKKGVKRKNFEMRMMGTEQFSPVKKRMNLKKTGDEDDENTILLRTSPRKVSMIIVVTQNVSSPFRRLNWPAVPLWN